MIARCFVHVINLANVDFISRLTKIAAIENTNTIWKYDPTLSDNRVLTRSLDMIAAAQTLAIKVSLLLVAGLQF